MELYRCYSSMTLFRDLLSNPYVRWPVRCTNCRSLAFNRRVAGSAEFDRFNLIEYVRELLTNRVIQSFPHIRLTFIRIRIIRLFKPSQ